jgi:hypothetical protein
VGKDDYIIDVYFADGVWEFSEYLYGRHLLEVTRRPSESYGYSVPLEYSVHRSEGRVLL